MPHDAPAIVIDNGTYALKAGLASEPEPRLHVAPVVGKVNRWDIFHRKLSERYVGETAEELESSMNLVMRRPIKKGIVRAQWGNMETIWDHTFRALEVETSEHFILMSESPLNTRIKRRKLREIMFEEYNVKGLYIANTANLAMYGVGETTGVVVDSGADVTHITPVYNGYSLRRNIKTVRVGGETLTQFMKSRLALRGYAFPDYSGIKTVRNIKEQLCFVAEDYKKAKKLSDTSKSLQKTFDLPDGRAIVVEDERFVVPEALMQPNLVRFTGKSLAEMIHKTIQASDVIIRDELYANIVLAGGNTMFPGLVERLQRELQGEAPLRVRININAVPDREHLAWHGGAALAQSHEFDRFWITREEYYEAGLHLFHHRQL